MSLFNLPTINPQFALPGTNLPRAQTTAQTVIPQQYYPMPQAVQNNVNLGWNYATGKTIQPLTAQQKAAVYIPPYSPNIQTPTQTVFPTTLPKATAPVSGQTGWLNPAPSPWLNYASPNWLVPPKIQPLATSAAKMTKGK